MASIKGMWHDQFKLANLGEKMADIWGMLRGKPDLDTHLKQDEYPYT